MKGRRSKSWAMAYCGMAAALSVAMMLMGAVFPIASFLIATVCVECGRTMALTAYGAVSLLSLLFVPDKEVALTFVFLLGYYPLAKPCFEKIRPALLRAVCKLLLCNGAVLAMYGLVLLLVPAGSIAEDGQCGLSALRPRTAQYADALPSGLAAEAPQNAGRPLTSGPFYDINKTDLFCRLLTAPEGAVFCFWKSAE